MDSTWVSTPIYSLSRHSFGQFIRERLISLALRAREINLS
jgi:hypothetical protein